MSEKVLCGREPIREDEITHELTKYQSNRPVDKNYKRSLLFSYFSKSSLRMRIHLGTLNRAVGSLGAQHRAFVVSGG